MQQKTLILKVLQVISQNRQKRLEYEARKKSIREHNQFLLEAEQRGISIGEQRINALNTILIDSNRIDELKRAATDKVLQTQLMDELLPKDLP